MKVLSGHLTQTERSVIKLMIDKGATVAKSSRKSYSLSKSGDIYTVTIQQNDRGIGWIGSQLRKSTYTHTFTL